jgi:DNA polymerase elongation subunit (family B)
MPFILLSKKRYVGMLYEEDPDVGYLKYMGLSIKRRDSCDYLKDTYGDIINILMNESNIQSAINYLKSALERLATGNVPNDKLLVTKALRGYYKKPEQIAHNVLAERIGKRDPGNKPKPGDRMRYLFFVNDKKKALTGEKIETPEYINETKLKIDYSYYVTNQLMKPLQQLFGLSVIKIWEKQNKTIAIKNYKKDLSNLQKECGGDFELFMKKKEKLSSTKVKILLFDDILRKINNEKANMKTISNYFN